MIKKIIFVSVSFMLGFTQCEESDRASEVVNKSILAHGFQKLEGKTVSFTFRGRNYSVTRKNGRYEYTREFPDSAGLVTDSLINSSDFTRYIDGIEVPVDEEWKIKYTRSINSVLYFFQLPYLLNDPAAIKRFEGETTINNEPYYTVKVTFQKEGGGEDYDDEYRYWFHRDKFTLDYFAYSYQVDGGGVRFREAENRVEKEGMIFQDYINYEVEKGTPLSNIPGLYEAGKLKVLSKIVNEAITVRPQPDDSF